MIKTRYLTYYETLEEQLAALFEELDNPEDKQPSAIERTLHIINKLLEHNLTMTPKAKPQTEQTANTWQKQFINYTLTETDKEQLKALTLDDKRIFDMLQEATSQGYEIKLAYNNKLKTFSATLFTTQYTPDNAGLALSGLGRTIKGATASALYKHLIVFKGKSWGNATTTAEEFA